MKGKILVTLSLPTPLYFCTGDSINWGVGPNDFLHRPMMAPKIKLGDPDPLSWYVMINDIDWSMYDDWRANYEDWGNFAVNFRKITRTPGESVYTTHSNFTLTKTEMQMDMNDRWARISLSGAVGLNPKACLDEGSRTLFPEAPSVIDVIRHGDKAVRFGGGSRGITTDPSGEERQYIPLDVRRRMDNPLDPSIDDGPVPLDEAIGNEAFG